MEPGGRHRQVGQLQHRPGRRRARGDRREDRVRLFGRYQPRRAHLGGRRRPARSRARARPGAPRSSSAAPGHNLYVPHDPLASLDDRAKVALLERARAPRARARPARDAGDGVARRANTRSSSSRAPTACSPPTCARSSRLSVQVIVEQDGRREQGSSGGGGRFDYAYFTDDVLKDYAKKAVDQALVNLDARPAPAGTMTVVLGPGLARRAAARGDRPRPRRRLQPQGHLGVQRPDRRARGGAGRHGGRRRHDRAPARLAQHRRRRQSDAAQRADRGRRAEGLHAGQPERAADGRAADRQRPARIVRAHPDAAHDQHLHAGRRQRPARRSSRRSRTASTR